MLIKKEILLKRVLPVILGAILGFSYYRFIGCKSGSCPITGSPYISTLYGAAVAFLISIPSQKRKSEKNDLNP